MDNQKENPHIGENGEAEEKKPVPEYQYGKYSNYQRLQTNRYNKENYKTITVRFRDNGSREMIQAAAKMQGVSLNSFCEELLKKEAYNILMEKAKGGEER
ncbi:MAG: hypothetical protein NC203_12185 [Firmicutes bacterium]|nr:hypothetical protein [[Eubacterium] siraeum]MCM1489112.1 hypothetical protein [Bacillota bacterium]